MIRVSLLLYIGWAIITALLFCVKYVLLDKLQNRRLKYILGMSLAYAVTLPAVYGYFKIKGLDLRLEPVTGIHPLDAIFFYSIPAFYSWILLQYKRYEERTLPLSRKAGIMVSIYTNVCLTICAIFVIRVYMFGTSLSKELHLLHIETDSVIGVLTITGVCITFFLGLLASVGIVWYAHKKGWKGGIFDINIPSSHYETSHEEVNRKKERKTLL